MSRKAIELGCAVAICLGICGISFGKYGGGSGTSISPYLIYTASQLNAIGADSNDFDNSFKLMADIDLSAYKGTQFNRIGIDYEHPFEGVLDGNGHTVSNFTYDSNSTDCVGLVGRLIINLSSYGGVIKDLRLVGIHVTGRSQVGGLVGSNAYGTVTNCSVSGSVMGYNVVGGLVGSSEQGTVTNCSTSGSVSGNNEVGGLVGSLGGSIWDTDGSITNCYSSCSVSGTDYVGGLVGSN